MLLLFGLFWGFFCFLIPNLLYNHDMLPVSYYLGFFAHLTFVKYTISTGVLLIGLPDIGTVAKNKRNQKGFFHVHVCVSMWVLPECQPSQHKRDYGKKYYETVRIVEWDMKRW